MHKRENAGCVTDSDIGILESMELTPALVVLSLFSKTTLQTAVEERRLLRMRQQGITEHVPQIRVGKQLRNAGLSPRRIRASNTATVTSVIDGSVFEAWFSNDVRIVVRLLGADAPVLSEQESDTAPTCFGNEAKRRLHALLLGQTVTLEEDASYKKDHDRRSLFYVALNGMDVNAWMIRNGFAFADTNNSFERSDRYLNAESEAKDDERGLWSATCDYHPNPKHRIRVIE